MKAFPWLIAGVGVGVALYLITNPLGPQHATGSDDIEDAADEAVVWGSKRRIGGATRGVAGKIKESVGRLTGDDQIANEGVADQAVGGVKDATGHVAQAIGRTVHELNR